MCIRGLNAQRARSPPQVGPVFTAMERGGRAVEARARTFWPLGIDGENGVTLDAWIKRNMSGEPRGRARTPGGRWLDVRELRGATGRKILMRRPGGNCAGAPRRGDFRTARDFAYRADMREQKERLAGAFACLPVEF